MKKIKTLHIHTHPVHWYASMFVAVVAIALTSLKSSSEIAHALQVTTKHHSVMDTLVMRERETNHLPILLNAGLRTATSSGS